MNLATGIVLLIVLIALGFAVRTVYKSRDKGCGGNCACCARRCGSSK